MTKYAPKKQNWTSRARKFVRWKRSLKWGMRMSFRAVMKPMLKYSETIRTMGRKKLPLAGVVMEFFSELAPIMSSPTGSGDQYQNSQMIVMP